MRRYLYDNTPSILHASQLRREDHDGHHHSQLAQHFPATRRRNQSSDVAGDTANWQIPIVYNGSSDLFDHGYGVCIEYSFPIAVYSRHVAVGSRAISSSSASIVVHAAAAGQVQ
jgi:hypothetical protein